MKSPGLLLALGIVLGASCAVHPRGEREERDRADAALRELDEAIDPVELPEHPTLDDWLSAAFHGNAELRARYWDWRAALERIPQEASPPRAAIRFGYLFGGGQMRAWDRTTVAVSNAPMSEIPWPTKLGTKGRMALEEARAAGSRFAAAKFRIQQEVVSLWADLALHAVLMDVQREKVALTELAAGERSAAVRTGRGSSEGVLDSRTRLDLARNDLANLHSQIPPLLARMNALVGRDPGAPIELPGEVPAMEPLAASDDELIALAAEQSPDLDALAREVAGKEEALDLARQAWLPDFGLEFGIQGSVSQALGVMFMLPTNVEAIRGGIRQAEAQLAAARAEREQVARDLAASFVLDLFVLRNAERQTELFEGTIVPRAEVLMQTARASYSTGTSSLAAYVEARMALLDARLAVAPLRAERAKTLAAIDAFARVDVDALHPVSMGGGLR
jgi:outer membrane protein TolC